MFEKKHYIIHFEPMDVWAKDAQQAQDFIYEKFFTNEEYPNISKILLAKHSFDRDEVKKIGL
jgi:hypothetical protein